MDFEQLGEQWQQQKIPNPEGIQAMESYSESNLLARLQKIQTQTVFTGLGLSISFAAVFVMMAWLYQMMLPAAWYFHLGVGLMGGAMLGILMFSWSMIFTYTHRSVRLDSQNFLRKVEKKLKRQEIMVNRGVPLYLLVLMLGLNLTYLELLNEASILFRLIAHVMTTMFTILFYVFTIPYFSRRSETRIEPVLKEVQALLRNWDDEEDG